MYRLTITQRIKIIKIYYKCGVDSATTTYCALSGNYGLHNRPTTQAIAKSVFTKMEGPVDHRFTRSAEIIAIVSEECVAEEPNVPISRCYLEL